MIHTAVALSQMVGSVGVTWVKPFIFGVTARLPGGWMIARWLDDSGQIVL